MTIFIRTIPHENQRYETVGDWQIDKQGNITILVSELGNPWYEYLIAIHELVEVILCKKRGITDDEVTRFDKWFEKRRKAGNLDEPGDDRKSPYRSEHCLATGIERVLASSLEVNWQDYDKKVNAL